MFTFPVLAVRKVIDRGIADAAVNGGFRVPCQGFSPAEQARSGLWLVGDQGVYLCSNGRLAVGQLPLCVFSEECHPGGDMDWWSYKRRHFGGDDGVEFIEAERLIPLFDRNFRATHLHVQLTDNSVSLSLIRR